MELDALYNLTPTKTHPWCTDCSILQVKKPCHTVIDYAEAKQADVLFLVDSLVWNGFSVEHLNASEEGLFDRYIKPIMKDTSWTILASVKCPDVKDKEMKPKDMNACRQFLDETIKRVKPKLIFTCGNLPLKMVVKESGIGNKRGSTYYYNEIPVIPLFHPMSVILEPRNMTLFQMDVHNGYNKYILHDTTPPKVEWTVVDESTWFKYDFLTTTDKKISIDIETTGLNFLRDKIQTVGITYKDGEQLKQLIIPLFHKEAPQLADWVDIVTFFLNKVCSNPKNKKVLQNAKFDMKFLLGIGVRIVNVDDTMLKSHLVDENMPKSLRDLVKQFFPENLEEL